MKSNYNKQEIENIIGYEFKNEKLLEMAFTHSSFAYVCHEKSNERLEFLGDSLLNFVTTDFLFKNFSEDEGELSKIKGYLVSAENLSNVIKKSGLINYLCCENFNPKNSENVMCDLFESIVGAIYLDSDILTCQKFIIKTLNYNKNYIESFMKSKINYKTKLQEIVQQKGKNDIKYVLLNKAKKNKDNEFEIGLYIGNDLIASAISNSKKSAESLCAKIALEKLQ